VGGLAAWNLLNLKLKSSDFPNELKAVASPGAQTCMVLGSLSLSGEFEILLKTPDYMV
jgi:hypothetical protein